SATPGCVWKINFHFDVRRDMYCPEALDRLRLPLTRGGGGIDFKEHFRRGVSVETFSELITGSGLVMSPEVTWITVGGAFLFAGLVKMLTGCRELPTTEEEFSETCYEYFPHIWDMRVCRGCSPKCGMSPRIPLHACASEMAILEACGSSSARVTSPTLAMLEVFFRYVRFGGRATSAVDDCSVSS
ncbi:CCR4-NOT transcription complex subunit, putative, partial [Perkinsus marinus ATCC 50983]